MNIFIISSLVLAMNDIIIYIYISKRKLGLDLLKSNRTDGTFQMNRHPTKGKQVYRNKYLISLVLSNNINTKRTLFVLK